MFSFVGQGCKCSMATAETSSSLHCKCGTQCLVSHVLSALASSGYLGCVHAKASPICCKRRKSNASVGCSCTSAGKRTQVCAHPGVAIIKCLCVRSLRHATGGSMQGSAASRGTASALTARAALCSCTWAKSLLCQPMGFSGQWHTSSDRTRHSNLRSKGQSLLVAWRWRGCGIKWDSSEALMSARQLRAKCQTQVRAAWLGPPLAGCPVGLTIAPQERRFDEEQGPCRHGSGKLVIHSGDGRWSFEAPAGHPLNWSNCITCCIMGVQPSNSALVRQLFSQKKSQSKTAPYPGEWASASCHATP